MEIIKKLIKDVTGYKVAESDDSLLEFLLSSERQHLLNDCGLDKLPNELLYVLHERTAGRFISLKAKDILGSDNLSVVTSIKEGDTTVDIGGTSNEERLSILASTFLRSGERDIACFRQIKW